MGNWEIDLVWYDQSGRKGKMEGTSKAMFDKTIEQLIRTGAHFNIQANMDYHA